MLLDGSNQTILLPIAVVEELMPLGLVTEPIPIKDLSEEGESPKSPKVFRDASAEHLMIEQLAAESIQNAFRYVIVVYTYTQLPLIDNFVNSFWLFIYMLIFNCLFVDAMVFVRMLRSTRG